MQLVVLELLDGKEGWRLWTLRMPPGITRTLLVPTRTYSYYSYATPYGPQLQLSRSYAIRQTRRTVQNIS